MSSSSGDEYAPSLADRLVAACWSGNFAAAKAAVAGGASVNEEGKKITSLPLTAAVSWKRHDLVVWLLSHGADPNGGDVMWYGARSGTTAILQLLIDAGGDVNRWGILAGPPLFPAVWGRNSEDNVRVLLTQPCLDFTIKYNGNTPEDFARTYGTPAVADMIAQEVSVKGPPVLLGS